MLKNFGSLEDSLRNVDLRNDLAWEDTGIAWCYLKKKCVSVKPFWSQIKRSLPTNVSPCQRWQVEPTSNLELSPSFSHMNRLLPGCCAGLRGLSTRRDVPREAPGPLPQPLLTTGIHGDLHICSPCSCWQQRLCSIMAER